MTERRYRAFLATGCLAGVAMMAVGFSGWWGASPSFGGLGLVPVGGFGLLWLASRHPAE